MSEPIVIELPPKYSADVLDYQVDFTKLIPAPYVLDDESVEIIAAGNGEVSFDLVASHIASVVPSCGGSGGRETAVLFWLQGGTPGVRYKGKITVSDNASGAPDREINRYFYIEISK